MSATDPISSFADITALDGQVKAIVAGLEKVDKKFIDTATSVKVLNDAILQIGTFKEFNAQTKAVSDGMDKLATTQKKVADGEAKLAAERDKAYTKYMAQLAKQQAEEDKATARAQVAMTKRLEAIDKETAKLEQAAAKRVTILSQDPGTYRGSSGNELTNDQFNAGQGRAEALANEKAALIATIEAEQLNTEAKTASAAATVEQNTALIANIEYNNVLKTQLSEVNAQLKASTVFDAELTAEQLRLTAAIREQNAVISQQIKEDISADGSLLAMKANLEQLRITYAGLNVAERENIAIGGVMLEEINLKEAALEKEVLAQGRARDAVGGYSSAIDKVIGRYDSLDKIGARVLQNVLRSVTRLAVEFTIFALASYAIEQLVAYIAKLDIFKDKLSAAVEILKDFNEVNKAVATDLGKSQTVFKVLSDTATDMTLSLKERTAAGAELIKQFPKELAGTTALSIANGDESEALKQLSKDLIDNAKARAALSRIQELQGQINDAEFEKEKIGNKNFNEVARGIEEYTTKLKALAATRTAAQNKAFGTDEAGIEKIIQKEVRNTSNARAKAAKDVQDERIKSLIQQQDFLTKYAGGEKKIAEVIETDDNKKDPKAKKAKSGDNGLSEQAENEKAIATSELNSYNVRLVGADLYYDTLNKISENERDKAIANGAKKVDADKKYAQDVIKNTRLKADLVTKIEQDEADRVYNIIANNYKDLQDASDEYTAKQLQDLAANYSIISLALSERYAKGLLNEKEYQEAKFQLTKTYNKLIRDEEIRALTERINNSKAAGSDTKADQDKLNKLLAEQNKDANDITTKDNEDTGKKLADQKKGANDKLKQLEKQATEEVINAIQSVGDAQFEQAKQQIETQKTAIDTQTQTQIDAENRSLDSTKTKQDKINLINAQANDKKAQLDKQARKIDHDKAVFDRAISVAKIIENTAIAITSAIAEFGVYGVAVGAALGAIGAVEIATVLSTPLPAYAKGGVHKGGKMIAGELGTELMIDPSGALSLTGSTAGVYDKPSGTRIVTHAETMRILATPDKVQYVGGQTLSTKQMEDLLGIVAENTKPRAQRASGSNPFPWRGGNDYIKNNTN